MNNCGQAICPKPVRKAKVIGMYEVLLYCPLCNTQMGKGEFKYELPSAHPASLENHWYEYTCPSCGHVHKSTIQYPYQQVQFDTADMEALPDEGEVK